MKSRSHIVMFVFLFVLLLIASSLQTVQAQTQPSVRYIALENANGSECTVVWSVFDVSQWADKIYFRLWVIRESEQIPVGFWEIGLSNILDQGPAQIMPGFGIQGVYANNVSIHQVTAESPFTSEQMIHPIDRLQTYYFYKSHVTFNFAFESDDTLLLAADYENDPDYYDGELPYYGPYNTGDYYRIEYANIPDVCQDSIIIDTIKPTAHAGLDQTVTVGAPVTFNAWKSSDNVGIVSYEWNFGDGSTGAGETVTYKYAKEGKYTVKLTVQDIVGNTDTTQITVTVVSEESLLLLIGVVATATILIVALSWFIWKRRKLISW